MTQASTPDLLTLHAVRLTGFGDTPEVAARFGMRLDETAGRLEAHRAAGRVARSAFAAVSGWSLTEEGRRLGESLLRDEIEAVGGREIVVEAHRAFVPLNDVVAHACTTVQLDPSPENHEAAWQALSGVAADLSGLEDRLADCLTRFEGYHRRFATALFRSDDDPAWLTGTDVDSCHRVWFELHEDLIATLGLSR